MPPKRLIRWVHPVRGLVPPGLFIPFAEHTGYIKMLTRWVLTEAIRQCGVWLRRQLHIEISVNLSARDLMTRDLPELISGLLAEHQVPAEMICLEITESGFMEDPGACATRAGPAVGHWIAPVDRRLRDGLFIAQLHHEIAR